MLSNDANLTRSRHQQASGSNGGACAGACMMEQWWCKARGHSPHAPHSRALPILTTSLRAYALQMIRDAWLVLAWTNRTGISTYTHSSYIHTYRLGSLAELYRR